MSSLNWYIGGTLSLAGSFFLSQASIPMQAGAAVSFLVGTASAVYEEKYVKPVKQMRYTNWREVVQHGMEVQQEASKGLIENKLNWEKEHHKKLIGLPRSVQKQYFDMFTQGAKKPKPQQLQTVQTQAVVVHENRQPVSFTIDQHPQHQTVETNPVPEKQPVQYMEQSDEFHQAATDFQYEEPVDEWDEPTPIQITQQPSNPLSPQAVTPFFPVEDIAQKMAEATLSDKTATSIIAIAPPGCGKTGLLQNAMYKTHRAWKGQAEFYIFAGKEGETYCGLEHDPNRYIYSGAVENARESVQRLESLNQDYASQATGHATIVVKDENNNTLRTCQLSDATEIVPKGGQRTKAHARMIGADYTALTRGRSKLYVEWLTAHGCRKTDTGQETTIFANAAGIVLGRTLEDGTPKYGAIQEALTGGNGNRVVDDVELRDALYQKFLEYRKRINEGLENPHRVICLTSVGGPWRLVMLPIYEKDCFTIAVVQPTHHSPEVIDAVIEPESTNNLWQASGLNSEVIDVIKQIQSNGTA